LSERPQTRGFVLFSETWHQGVIGIAASRIVEEFSRPALLLAINRTKGLAHGSGRSIRALNLHEALTASSAQLVTFGGHAAAAGLTIEPEKIDAFRTEFEAVLLGLLTEQDLVPRLHIDARVGLHEVTSQLCADLERCEPCGMGNPRALLAIEGADLPAPPRLMGRDEKHVSFFVKQAPHSKRVVAFNFAPHFHTLCDLAQRSRIDVAFRPQLNTFNGQSNVELLMEAFKLSGT
jgi:single-stranded-DNA-specific exonuclease